MFCFVFPICKESLTSLLHIDSCWVYYKLRSLTSLLYMIYVCRGSFTSPSMHYIVVLCELGLNIPLSYNTHCREANLTSSSLWIYIAYKSLSITLYYPFLIFLFLTKRGRKICFWFAFTLNPLLMIDKKGEKYLWYMHDFLT